MSVTYELHEHVARVTIDRPDVLTAIDASTETMLQEIWSELENEPDARVVVLTGSGEKAFSVGADMKDASEDAATGLEYWAKPRPGGFGGIALRTTLDVPVIARVNGSAARRRVRDGARLRHRRRVRGSSVRLSRAARGPDAARRVG